MALYNIQYASSNTRCCNENIHFIHEGRLWWHGEREDLLTSDNVELNEFIFASGLMRQVKKAMLGKA